MRMRCCEARFHVDTTLSSCKRTLNELLCSSVVMKELGFMLHACDLVIGCVISVLGSYSQSVYSYCV